MASPRVFMLHRVLPYNEKNSYYFQRQTAISWDRFIALLNLIEKKGWRTRGLSLLSSGFSDNDVFISFDDGYADNRQAFNEILNRGMTATLFPVKNFVQANFSPIDDMAHHLMQASKVSSNVRASLLNGRLKRLLRRLTEKRYRTLRQRWFELDCDAQTGQLFLSEDEIRYWCGRGIELGIHGASHRVFTGLTNQALTLEINLARKWLYSLGANTGLALCFPHGSHDQRVVKQCLAQEKILLGVDTKPVCSQVIRRQHIIENQY